VASSVQAVAKSIDIWSTQSTSASVPIISSAPVLQLASDVGITSITNEVDPTLQHLLLSSMFSSGDAAKKAEEMRIIELLPVALAASFISGKEKS
jgi:hypothetical protein